jgi:NagD protein
MAEPKIAKFGFLIDMDGVIYRGHEPIPGAVEFIKTLLKFDIPFLFLTNNSQRTSRDVVARLQRMDLKVSESHIFTSAMATAKFLARQKPKGTAYVIGEGGLLNALYDNGFTIVDHDPDYVVVGEGKALTLEMIDTATRMIAQGSKLIATNLDPSCPTSNGSIRPGCGAFVSLLEKATGAQAFGAGKPSPVMFRAARKELGLSTDETIMIGDTMETDILGALQMGYHTALVLTGGTSSEDLQKFPYLPEIVVDSIAELLGHEPLKSFLETRK